ncbi:MULTISPECIES: hypothetical protein [Streptomyces]|uniref:hypothetical protein n=1 Tax=Streptomyces TaxID=1883 RepID=UPI001F0BAAA1|nr:MULTISPECIES: hypothetical protein [Streptomyces]
MPESEDLELGYRVTLVRDATAALTPEKIHAALELNGPTYAHAIVTTDQLVTAFGQPGCVGEIGECLQAASDSSLGLEA